MSTSNFPRLSQVIETGDPTAIDALMEATDTLFWVDWREEDDAIAGYCETILQTGTLAAEFVDVEDDEKCEFHVSYNGKRVKVPWTFSPKDRHITICALNEILQPDYEIRFFTASAGMDTLAFVPLPTATWKELEARYGESVGQHFYRITAKPNLFTDPLPF